MLCFFTIHNYRFVYRVCLAGELKYYVYVRVNVGRGIFDEYFGYFNENFELNWESSLVLKPNLRDVVTER